MIVPLKRPCESGGVTVGAGGPDPACLCVLLGHIQIPSTSCVPLLPPRDIPSELSLGLGLLPVSSSVISCSATVAQAQTLTHVGDLFPHHAQKRTNNKRIISLVCLQGNGWSNISSLFFSFFFLNLEHPHTLYLTVLAVLTQ